MLSEFEIVNLVRFSHIPKAKSPISVTESGIIIEVKPVCQKALSPIIITELGINVEFKPTQNENALIPIEITEFGIITEVK